MVGSGCYRVGLYLVRPKNNDIDVDGDVDGDGDGSGGDGDDDKFLLQEADATLTPGRDNWGMGSMGGHPMMNNGGEPVSGSLLIMTIKMTLRIKKYQ